MNKGRLLSRPGFILALAALVTWSGLAVGDRVSPAAAQGALIFEDNFSKKDSGWIEFNDENASRQYNGGEYVITVKATTPYAAFGNHNRIVSNFDLAVKFRFITPSDVADGYAMFVWRYSEAGYYALFLDPYGSPNQCRFDRLASGRVFTILQLPCDGIMKTAADEWNELHVVARGSDMTFIINDVKVVDLRDRFLRDGVFGLGAVNRTNPTGMKVAWDDIKVYAPEAAPTWTNTPKPSPTLAPEMPTDEPTSTTIPSPTPRPTRLPTDEPTAVRPTRTPGPTQTPNAGGKLFMPSLFRTYASDSTAQGYGAYRRRSAISSATLSGSW